MSSFPRLPEGIYSTYRQYKHNNQVILQWVHATVIKIRQAASQATSTFSKGSHKKPKARTSKNFFKHRETPVDVDLSSPQVSFRVFLDLIKEIAASGAAIPASYLALLSATIKQRKSTAAFYSTDADAWRSNETHRRAIEVYEEALGILQRAQEARRGEETKGKEEELQLVLRGGDEDDALGLAVTLQRLALAVQEDAANASGSGNAEGTLDNEWIRDNPLVYPGGASKPKARTFPLDAYELVFDEDRPATGPARSKNRAEEAQLALSCFILDVDHLRKHCAAVWKTVIPCGTTSRITASFVTNHAVHLVKQLEYDLIVDFPEFQDVEATQNILVERVIGVLPWPISPDGTLYNVLESMMTYTWEILDGFSGVLDSAPDFPTLKDGHFGYFDPGADRDAMSPAEKAREDKCILGTHLPDLVLMYRSRRPGQDKGEFLGDYGLPKEFRPMVMNTSRPRSWTLLFCCQMVLDCLHARRRFLRADLSAMRTLARELGEEADKFLGDGVTYDMNIMESPKRMCRVTRGQVMFWAEKDPLTDFKVANGFHKLSAQATQRDSLWLYNPWLTANMMAQALVDSFNAGVGVMGAGGFVQSAMHLWNMLRWTEQLPPAPECEGAMVRVGNKEMKSRKRVLLMDHLIDVIGDKVFSGSPPKDKFLTGFHLMLGVRPEAFAKEKRERKKTAKPPPHKASNEAGRGVLPEVSDAWRLHDDKYVLHRDKFRAGKVGPTMNSLERVRRIVESELGQGDAENNGWARGGPLLNLNILKIHQLCVRVFTELQALRPELERVYSFLRYDGLFPTQIQWPMMTGWIARSVEVTPDGKLDRMLLVKAGEIVQKVLGTKETAFYVIHEESGE